MENRNPTELEVRSIMNEVYNVWFKKYKHAQSDEDFKNAMCEAHEINKKYPFKLCQDLIFNLLLIIESYYKERNGKNEQG